MASAEDVKAVERPSRLVDFVMRVGTPLAHVTKPDETTTLCGRGGFIIRSNTPLRRTVCKTCRAIAGGLL